MHQWLIERSSLAESWTVVTVELYVLKAVMKTSSNSHLLLVLQAEFGEPSVLLQNEGGMCYVQIQGQEKVVRAGGNVVTQDA